MSKLTLCCTFYQSGSHNYVISSFGVASIYNFCYVNLQSKTHKRLTYERFEFRQKKNPSVKMLAYIAFDKATDGETEIKQGNDGH